jgi:hypothetical protein
MYILLLCTQLGLIKLVKVQSIPEATAIATDFEPDLKTFCFCGDVVQYDHAVNEHGWMDDEEFGRQRLCGINPVQIELLRVISCALRWVFSIAIVSDGQLFEI